MWRGEECTSHVLIRSAVVVEGRDRPAGRAGAGAGESGGKPRPARLGAGLDRGRCHPPLAAGALSRAVAGLPAAVSAACAPRVSGFTRAKAEEAGHGKRAQADLGLVLL